MNYDTNDAFLYGGCDDADDTIWGREEEALEKLREMAKNPLLYSFLLLLDNDYTDEDIEICKKALDGGTSYLVKEITKNTTTTYSTYEPDYPQEETRFFAEIAIFRGLKQTGVVRRSPVYCGLLVRGELEEGELEQIVEILSSRGVDVNNEGKSLRESDPAFHAGFRQVLF